MNIEYLKNSIPKRLDKLPYSRFHTFIIISLGISWILDGYEVSLLSVLSGVIETSFEVTEKEIGLSGSFYLLGCVVGSLLFGFLASSYGRRTLFNITLIIYGLSIISTSFSIDIYMFYICRFFTGISVGGEYSSIFAAIDELIPPSIRGRADLIIDGTWHFGSFLASLISFLVLNYSKNDVDYQNLLMRILFSLGALCIIPVIFMRRYIPESPRWLIYKGKYKEASKVMNAIEIKCNIKKDNDEIDQFDIENSEFYLKNEENPLLFSNKYKSVQNFENKKIKKTTFKDIFLFLFKTHKRRFFYSVVLMSSQAFFYNNIVIFFSLAWLAFWFGLWLASA